MAEVGSVLIKVGANAAGMTAGLDKAGLAIEGFAQKSERRIGQFVRNTDRELTALSASMNNLVGLSKNFLVGLVAGLGAGTAREALSAVREEVEKIAKITNEAARSGFSTKAFQEWSYVAQKMRIDTDAMTDGLKELNIRADEFAKTAKGSAAESFSRIGFTPEQVKRQLEDPSRFLLEILDRVRQLDTAAQTRVMDEIFGGTAAERAMVLLQQSDGALKSMIADATTAGAVMDEKMLRKAEELDQAFRDVSVAVGTYLSGAIIRAADDLYSFIELFRSWENTRESTVDERLAELGKERLDIENQILQVKEAQDEAAKSDFGDRSAGAYAGELARLKQRMQEIADEEERILKARENIAKIEPVKPSTFTPAPYETPQAAAAREKAAKDAEIQAKAVSDLISELEFEYSLLQMTAPEQARAEALRKAGSAATDDQRQRIIELTDAIFNHNEALKQMRDQEREAAQEQRKLERAFEQVGESIVESFYEPLKDSTDILDRFVSTFALVDQKFINDAFKIVGA